VIPGDGVGPEIVDATLTVLNEMALPLEFVSVEAGRRVWEKTGKPILEETMDVIKSCDVILKGPVETPPGRETYKSVTVTLRKELGLYANLRPFKSEVGLSLFPNVDILIVRENTEGLYSGIEHRLDENVAIGVRVITRRGCEKILRFAFDYAVNHERKKVTAVHKANVLKETCGLFLEVARKTAAEYLALEYDELHVDAAAYKLIEAPDKLDVLVTTNMFGDILSDEAAGVTGGLGIAASANIGDNYGMFEAVHGTAPNIAGRGIANPAGLMKASAMMLEHLGLEEEASRLRLAVTKSLGNREARTPDVKGRGNTRTFTREVIKNLKAP